MLSHVADDAQYEHVERFVHMVDAHFMQAPVIGHGGFDDVGRRRIGDAVDELQIERGVFVRGERPAKRFMRVVVIEKLVANERHNRVERAFDIAHNALRVPFLQTCDELVNVGVEHGGDQIFLAGEVVIEQRARHVHTLGDCGDRRFREAALFDEPACALDNFKLAIHAFLLPLKMRLLESPLHDVHTIRRNLTGCQCTELTKRQF